MKTLFEPLLNGLYNIGQCPVFMTDKAGNVLFKKIPWGGDDMSLSNPTLFSQYLNAIKGSSCPLAIGKDQNVGGYFFPDSSILMVGPVLKGDDSTDVYNLRALAINTQLDSIAFSARRLVMENPPLDINFGAGVLNELDEVKHLMPQWVDVVPDERPHSSYLFELRALDAITQGEAQDYVLAQNSNRNGQDGTLAYTPLRSAQNLGICGVVLNSRAAVAGGLGVEQAYTMADYLILGIERCTNPKDAAFIGFKSGVIFARLVHDLKVSRQQKHPPRLLCQQARELIKRCIHIKTDRLVIAKELGVNADYLDRILIEDFNVTITQCLRDERIEEAKRLLVQTVTPIYEIAELLLFNHSSHFAKVFKSVTGVTPKAYRERKLSFVASATIQLRPGLLGLALVLVRAIGNCS